MLIYSLHIGMKKMEYKTRQWHEKCFVCCTCHNPIGTKSFIPKEHDIYCAKCYEDKFATKCIKCNKVSRVKDTLKTDAYFTYTPLSRCTRTSQLHDFLWKKAYSIAITSAYAFTSKKERLRDSFNLGVRDNLWKLEPKNRVGRGKGVLLI